jgi:hypothetical protein
MFSMTGEQVFNDVCVYLYLLMFLNSNTGGGCLVRAKRKYHIAVAGRGMQMVEFSPPEDD